MKKNNYVYNEIKKKNSIIKNNFKLLLYNYPGIIFLFFVIVIIFFLCLYQIIYLPIIECNLYMPSLNNHNIFNIFVPKLYSLLLILDCICSFYIIRLSSYNYQKLINLPIPFYSLILSNFFLVFIIFVLIMFFIAVTLTLALKLNITYFIIFFIISIIISILNILLIIYLENITSLKLLTKKINVNFQIIVHLIFIALFIHFFMNLFNMYIPYFYLIFLLFSPIIINQIVQKIYYLKPDRQIIDNIQTEKNKYFLYLNKISKKINIYLRYEIISFLRNINHYLALVLGLIICIMLIRIFFSEYYSEIINCQMLNSILPSLTAISIGIDYEYKKLLIKLPFNAIKRNLIKYFFNLFNIVILLFFISTIFEINIKLKDIFILITSINIIYILTIFLKTSIISNTKYELLLFTLYMFINFLIAFIFYELLMHASFLLISCFIVTIIQFKRSLL